MSDPDDITLLKRYVRGDEAAFTALFDRYVHLVYSAALRQARNPSHAEEVTQAVFILLARKADALSPKTVLSGWLYQAARLTTASLIKREIRRQRREQEVYMRTSTEPDTSLWEQISPLLDDAMGRLGETDRNAIVLRFFENRTPQEVAAALKLNEVTARKRVSRALEKLRTFFARRGVVLTAANLAGTLSSNSVQAAPAALANPAAALAIAKGVMASGSTLSLVKGVVKIMAWTNTKVAIGASVVVLLAVQQHQNVGQARQIASARQQLSGQAEELAAAESRAQELENQTASILETERSQQKDLERLQARRKAAGQGSQPLAGARAPSTLLAATLRDPGARQALRQQLLTGIRTRLRPLIEGLKLTEETSEKLSEAGVDQRMKNVDTAVAFTEGTLTAEAAVQTEANTERDANDQVRQLLGEEGFASYQESEKEFPARTLVDEFNNQLGPFPISAFQREALARAIEAEPPEVSAGLAGDFTVRELVSPDGLDGRFAAQAESNQRILQAAAGFLSPEQVESLRLMQVSNMSAQKSAVLRMLRKL